MRLRSLLMAILSWAAISGLCPIVWATELQTEPDLKPRWQEARWPFARDAWPRGLAVRCAGAECGAGIDLFVRPKLGFCNCATGVSDDFEVDNVTDLDLISDHFMPTDTGRPITFGQFKGRARAYKLPQGDKPPRAAFAVALASGCDLIVAAASGESLAQVEAAAQEFLSMPQTQNWIETSLGLR